ncbi:MAG: hypothetical protein VB122_08680 [Erysipelotrichales bacterium]|nr:hypothetical protein [Erysipelotrichales bacterium]
MSKKKKVFLILVISFLAVIVLFFSVTAPGQSLIYSLIFEPNNDYTVLDSYGFVDVISQSNDIRVVQDTDIENVLITGICYYYTGGKYFYAIDKDSNFIVLDTHLLKVLIKSPYPRDLTQDQKEFFEKYLYNFKEWNSSYDSPSIDDIDSKLNATV